MRLNKGEDSDYDDYHDGDGNEDEVDDSHDNYDGNEMMMIT